MSRDAAGMSALFAETSAIFENGKAEGSFANYMDHHLGPELDAITSFTFTDPTLSVTRNGHMAYGYETYGYRIELEDGRVIERDGVATSVLSHDESGWKIVQYHSSSRAPRRP
ncbi:nuclear transport factor 2 family protein [Citromicrobium bathyomarinum]